MKNTSRAKIIMGGGAVSDMSSSAAIRATMFVTRSVVSTLVGIFGRYENGRLARMYWPDGRLEFRMAGVRIAGYIERDKDGTVFGTAERVR